MPKMKSPKKTDKREAILKATLEVMAEYGFDNAPMSLISKRAKASPGIIYHYFTSKDELVQAVYERIFGNSLRAFETADDPKAPLPRRFLMLWSTVYHYCFAHPLEIAFLDQYENSPISRRGRNYIPVESLSFDQMLAVIAEPKVFDRLSRAEKALVGLMAELRTRNLIKDLPQAAISEFAVGVPRRLARQGSAGSLKLEEEALDAIAKACWQAIAS